MGVHGGEPPALTIFCRVISQERGLPLAFVRVAARVTCGQREELRVQPGKRGGFSPPD